MSTRLRLAALAAPLAVLAVAPSADAARYYTAARYGGDQYHDGCLAAGCSFSVTASTCLGLRSGPERVNCTVTVSGWLPDPNLDSIYNATLWYYDPTGTKFGVPLVYDGVSFRGAAASSAGTVVSATGTLVFTHVPSGVDDPPPPVAHLQGIAERI